MNIAEQVKGYQPGLPLNIKSENFTPDFQEKVIDIAMNGVNVNPNSAEPSAPQEGQQANPQQEQGGDTVTVQREELDRYRNMERMMNDPSYREYFEPQQLGSNPADQNRAPNYNRQEPQQESGQQDNSGDNDNDWGDIFGLNTQDNQNQPTEPDRDQPNNNQNTNQNDNLEREYKTRVGQASKKYGVDPKGLDNFISRLDISDMAQIYKGWVQAREKMSESQQGNGSPTPQRQQPVQTQQRRPASPNLSDEHGEKQVRTYQGLNLNNKGNSLIDFGVY
jgi:hypothetical protein